MGPLPPQLDQHWQQMLEALPELIIILDRDHRILWMNQAMAARLQIAPPAVLGTRCFEHLHASGGPPSFCPLQQVTAQAQTLTFEAAIEALSGIFQITVAPLLDHHSQSFACVHFFREVTEERRLQKELRQERDFSQAVLEVMDTLVVILDEEGHILTFNHACEEISGFTAAEVKGKPIWDILLPEAEVAQVRKIFLSLACGQAPQRGRNHWLTKDGGLRLISWANTLICRPNGKFIIATGIDITEQQQAEERMARLAHYDILTDLPNRKLFSDRLHQAMARARRSGRQVAVMFLDLDQFKPVNDQHGHETGDLLLRQVAERIRAAVRETDTVGRIGGDEFVIAVEGLQKSADAAPVAIKIIDSLRRPFDIEGRTCLIGVSIGVTIYPADGQEIEPLIKKADHAMYEAKKAGGNNFQFYEMPPAGRS